MADKLVTRTEWPAAVMSRPEGSRDITDLRRRQVERIEAVDG